MNFFIFYDLFVFNNYIFILISKWLTLCTSMSVACMRIYFVFLYTYIQINEFKELRKKIVLLPMNTNNATPPAAKPGKPLESRFSVYECSKQAL